MKLLTDGIVANTADIVRRAEFLSDPRINVTWPVRGHGLALVARCQVRGRS